MLQPKVLDLNLIVTDTGRMLRRPIGDHIEFALRLEPIVGQVRVDPGQLDQVLMNLAVNGRDAMPDGGTLSIVTRQTHLDESAAALPETNAGPHAMLSISDTGVGLTPDVLQHIFEPFFTTKAPGTGTGLGLATVFGIVRQSGGAIQATSEPGSGSTFTIYLPLVTDAAIGGIETGGASVVVSDTAVPWPFRTLRTNSSK